MAPGLVFDRELAGLAHDYKATLTANDNDHNDVWKSVSPPGVPLKGPMGGGWKGL